MEYGTIKRPVSVPLVPNLDSRESSIVDSSTRGSSPIPPLSSRDDNVDTEFSDDSDDELQDWSLVNSISKKGMKDLEPLLNDSDINKLSAYDQKKLNKARNMRFSALAVKRGAIVNLENLKASTIYINVDDHSDLFMLQPKGKFLETMGFIDNQNICHFGFEEVLYLVERGTCMLKYWDKSDNAKNNVYEKMPPFSLQSAYALLIKNEDQLNQYLVYSILKRDGYIINRHSEFNGKISEKKNDINTDIFKNLKLNWWTKLLVRVSNYFKTDFPFKYALSYYNIFTYLHSKIIPQSIPKLTGRPITEHKISFNVWKPSPTFKKKNSPLPDYQLSIFKAAQKLPKYAEIKSLLERANSNIDTHKPKTKPRKGGPQILDTANDYAKGIDINKIKYDPNRITLAIIDNTTVNFITLSNCSFVGEGPVWRDHWVTWKPPVKKKNKNRKNNKNKNKKGLEVNTSLPSLNNNIQKAPATANF